jgi:hypothetical protein
MTTDDARPGNDNWWWQLTVCADANHVVTLSFGADDGAACFGADVARLIAQAFTAATGYLGHETFTVTIRNEHKSAEPRRAPATTSRKANIT